MTDGLNRRQRNMVEYYRDKKIKRLKQLEIEIIMGNYYDGWTLKGIKKEVKNIKEWLEK